MFFSSIGKPHKAVIDTIYYRIYEVIPILLFLCIKEFPAGLRTLRKISAIPTRIFSLAPA
ncbi:hypothetical protein HMPREF1548_05648 [Clostridium sp. KLE 1755]|nr:hypothetical protein HMPREF1548_05648 [Clostridium sp. KLE 1755]